MTHPVRLQLSRKKGFRLQAHSRAVNGLPAVKVDRTTKWGNPFKIGSGQDRKECVYLFLLLQHGYHCISSGPGLEATEEYNATVKREWKSLSGKNLACWCSLPKPGEPDICHAAVLLEVAKPKARRRQHVLDALFDAVKGDRGVSRRAA